MSKENLDVLPVVSSNTQGIIGILSCQHILSGNKSRMEDHLRNRPHISLKRKSLKHLVHGTKAKKTIHSFTESTG